MDTKNPIHPILTEIEAFCAARGMRDTTFGKLALGDPSFVSSLRRGRDLRWRTQCAVRHFMLTGHSRHDAQGIDAKSKSFVPVAAEKSTATA